ncbi:MAG: hypothetical protein ABSC06_03795 [Rhodopila sp.]|jgi:hypothetical protein
MRTGTLLCSQTTQGLEPLGAFNQPVFRSYGQIRAALLNELGPGFADYFARPDSDTNGTRIGWLAHDLGEPRRWIDLPAAEQARLQPILKRTLDGFGQYRAQLDAAPLNSPRNNFGKLLAQASYVPGPEYLYFMGDQPVTAFWGFKTTKMAEGVDPLRLVPGATVLGDGPGVVVQEAVRTIVVKRRRRWWLWLLGLLGLLLLAWLLAIWAWWTDQRTRLEGLLQLSPPAVTAGARPVESNELPNLRSSVTHQPEGVLTDRRGIAIPADQATGRSAVATDQLPAGTGLVPGQGHPVPPVDGSGPDEARPKVPPEPPSNTARPDVPLPPVHPTVPDDNRTIPAGLPALPPIGGGAERGPALSVPANPPPGPAGFMQGTWRSRSGLLLNGKPAEEFYRFNENGQGDVTLRTRDGATQCSGPAQASVGEDHRLSLKEASSLQCSDGTSVAGAVTECGPGTDRAVCEGTNESGSRFGVQIEGVKKP